MEDLILDGIDKEIEDIFYSYVKIRSITFSEYERDAELFLMNYIGGLDYFKENIDKFGKYKIQNDILERNVCWGFIKGEGDETVVLMHHYDVVSAEDFKNLKSFAFSPVEIEKQLIKIKDSFQDEIKQDLESGKYIFGRGSADMKAGGAIQLALFSRYSKMKKIKGNILLISVPDEENLSSGMRSAVLLLDKLKNKYKLKYLNLINSEPHTRQDDEIGILTEGSVGKMMPFVYVRGYLSHIGNVFDGFNPLTILNGIVKETELNLNLCDFVEGEASPPPTWLYLKDRKFQYDVSIPLSCGGYFSILTLNREPQSILEYLKNLSIKAFDNAIKEVKDKYELYNKKLNKNVKALPWKVRVLTFKELYEEAFKDKGQAFELYYNSILEKINEKINNNEISMIESGFDIVEEILDYINNLYPIVVIGLAPPYYPNVSNLYLNNMSTKVKYLSNELIEYAKLNFKEVYKREHFFMGISDMSYTSIKNSKNILDCLKQNMPLYGDIYSIPLDKIEGISMASINIGPWGKDLHKLTERVYREDLFYRMPRLINHAISILLEWN